MLRSAMKRTRRKTPSVAVKAYWDSLPGECVGCGMFGASAGSIVIHHILATAPGKIGRRDHMLIVKLCPGCHNTYTASVHLLGSEAAFMRETGVDLVAIAVKNRDAWLAQTLRDGRHD